MPPVSIGSPVPPIDDAIRGPHAVVFFKVTCPVCQMAAPTFGRLARAHGGSVVGVGQDPAPVLEEFARTYDMTTVPSRSEGFPYPLSDAYGVEVVPTLFLVDEQGVVADVTESWDREGFNRVAGRLAELTGSLETVFSDPSDGLPPFRPG